MLSEEVKMERIRFAGLAVADILGLAALTWILYQVWLLKNAEFVISVLGIP